MIALTLRSVRTLDADGCGGRCIEQLQYLYDEGAGGAHEQQAYRVEAPVEFSDKGADTHRESRKGGAGPGDGGGDRKRVGGEEKRPRVVGERGDRREARARDEERRPGSDGEERKMGRYCRVPDE